MQGELQASPCLVLTQSHVSSRVRKCIPEQHLKLGWGCSRDIVVAPFTPCWAGTQGWMPCDWGMCRAGRGGTRSLHFVAILGASAHPLEHRDGLLLQGLFAAPKSSFSKQTWLPSTARGITVRIQNMLGKAGERLAHFAIHGTNLSEIHFHRKKIFF